MQCCATRSVCFINRTPQAVQSLYDSLDHHITAMVVKTADRPVQRQDGREDVAPVERCEVLSPSSHLASKEERRREEKRKMREEKKNRRS